MTDYPLEKLAILLLEIIWIARLIKGSVGNEKRRYLLCRLKAGNRL